MYLRYSFSVVAPMHAVRRAPAPASAYCGVHRAFGRARADQGVQLVDKQNNLAAATPRFLSRTPSAGLRTRRDILRPRSSRPGRARPRACSSELSGTSPETMRCASPSTMAVLPTPGSPISTGLFFVRRDSTWITRRISSSRPITGSSLPLRASSVRSLRTSQAPDIFLPDSGR